jgi:hypothetical protein
MPYTCDCGTKLDLKAALDALPSEHLGSSGMFSPTCTCGKSVEVRLRNGGYDVGYSYFGGSMHFEPMQRVRVKGLEITPSEPDDLHVVLGTREWHFGIRRPTSSRFCVFAQAFAAGKRVDELDFAQWGVTLTGIHRADARLDFGAETLVAANDFLYLSGPAPALTRAWHYMNDGGEKKA